MTSILLFLTTLILGFILGFIFAFILVAYVIKHTKKGQLEKALRELNTSSFSDNETFYEDEEDEENLEEEEISED